MPRAMRMVDQYVVMASQATCRNQGKQGYSQTCRKFPLSNVSPISEVPEVLL
jgi:hypothetical protein